MSLTRPLTVAALVVVLAAGAAACDDDDNVEPETTAVVAGAGAETTEPSPETTEAPASTAPEGTVTESSGPSSSAPTECAEEPTEETAGELVLGLSEADATEAVEACGWTLRVVRADGEDQPVTLDLRPNRVNVEVTDGVITAVVNIG
jgi:hypothetical protein